MIETALFGQVAFFVIVCVAFVSARSASFFHPLCLYLIFHLLVFIIRPLMVYFLNFDGIWQYLEYRATDAAFMYTLWISSLGLLFFAVTVMFSSRCDTTFSHADLPPWTTAERRAFAVVVILLGPIAAYSATIASSGVSFENDGDVQMTRDLATGIAIYTNTTGYIAEAHAMMGAICILALWRFNFRAWAYFPFIFFIGYRSFLGWGRWGIITSFLSLVLIYLYRNNIRWLKMKYLVLAIPIAVLFQSLGMDRDLVRDYVEGNTATNRVAAAPLYSDESSFWNQFDSPDFANFEFLAYVLNAVPEKTGTYTYFTQYLQLFTEPIPRIIWNDKPIGQPIKLFNLNDYGNFRGMTTSLVGDGWMSLGLLGLAVTMTLVGLLLGYIHRAFWRNQFNPRIVMAYCVFLPLSIQWYRDGGISIAKFTLFSLTPIILWTFLSKIIAELQGQSRVASRRRGPPDFRRRGPFR